MPDFTPGPLTVTKEKDTFYDWWIWSEDGLIAEVTKEEDAHLFAVSPALYQFVKKVADTPHLAGFDPGEILSALDEIVAGAEELVTAMTRPGGGV